MKIVVDTNVLISGVFFGGFPGKILKAIVEKNITACATIEIIEEYREIIDEMIVRKQGRFNSSLLSPLIHAMTIVDSISNVHICRDPDDDKFISCALDADAYYIVSGDKDLLCLGQFDKINIVTAKEFCEANNL